MIAEGTPGAGYSPVFFSVDGTLVYQQFEPKGHEKVTWWSLNPGTGSVPVQVDAASPMMIQVTNEQQAQLPQVSGKAVHLLGTSRDGQWSLIIFSSYDEVYLIRSDLAGEPIPLPGAFREWARWSVTPQPETQPESKKGARAPATKPNPGPSPKPQPSNQNRRDCDEDEDVDMDSVRTDLRNYVLYGKHSA